MNKILIISATSFTNHELSLKIQSLLEKYNADSEIVNLEDYSLPLFTAKDYKENKNNINDIISRLTKKFIKSDGLVFCAPEYNGSIPPIVTNCIAWISVSTDYWRDAFKDKIGLIATSSGGNAAKYCIAMKNQLEHLGVVVMPRTINVTSNESINSPSAEKILLQFSNLL